MDRSTCRRLAPRSGNGFPAFRPSAVSECDKRLLGVRATVPPLPPVSARTHVHGCKYPAALTGTHAQRPERKSCRKRVAVFTLAQITRHGENRGFTAGVNPPRRMEHVQYLPARCVSVHPRANLCFTEGSRNTISSPSSLVWTPKIHLHH